MLNDHTEGPSAWSGITAISGKPNGVQAHANDIIQWDGTNWQIIFDSTAVTTVTYITNAYTGIQYKWEDGQWTKSFEGIYENVNWRMIL